jgi:hypothetical protein
MALARLGLRVKLLLLTPRLRSLAHCYRAPLHSSNPHRPRCLLPALASHPILYFSRFRALSSDIFLGLS